MFNYLKRHLSWVIGGILVCSFLSSFVFGILSSSKDPVIVRFKSLPQIKTSELVAKCAQFGSSASDPFVQEEILREMINERIINDLVDVHSLNCSDEILEQCISSNPLFKGDKGGFDVAKFNKYLAQLNMNEAGFKKIAKRNLLTQCILNVFCSVPASDNLLKSAQTYQLQSRKVCLAQLNFNHPTPVRSPTEEELRNIYTIYKQEFALPETRSIQYCTIENPSVQSINQKEVDQYFKDNIDQFEGKKINQVSLEIKNILIEQRLSDIKIRLYQIIDSVSHAQSLSLLNEIAQKFGGKISHIVDGTYDQISQNLDLASIGKEIFKTPKGRLCDPYFSQEKVIICFIQDVKPTLIPAFETINKQLKAKFIEVQRKIENEKRMDAFVSKIKGMNKVSKERFVKIAAPFGISCSASFEVTNLDDANKVPDFILNTIFDTAVPGVTPVFVNEENEKFCAVFVESSFLKDTNLVSLEQLEEKLRFNLLTDLYEYLYRKEEPKIVSK
jgi:SurA N-terminal domain